MRLAIVLLLCAWPAVGAAGPKTWLSARAEAARGKIARWVEQRGVKRSLARIDPLLVPAFKAMKDANAPYSDVRMGAALTVRRRGVLGRLPGVGRCVVRGFNSESDGDVQLCAEQAAMAGLPRRAAGQNPVQKIAVVSERVVPSPCGRCLQVLAEVGNPETEVVAANLRGEHRRYRLAELLPADFPVAPREALEPHAALIAQAVQVYRQSVTSGVNRYRPAVGTAMEADDGQRFVGMVIKDTASTFTPATQLPLDNLVQSNVTSGRRARVSTMVIVGAPRDQSVLPVPTGDERQHLVDMNPQATVVLYNPEQKVGAVLKAQDLLPHAYRRGEATSTAP